MAGKDAWINEDTLRHGYVRVPKPCKFPEWQVETPDYDYKISEFFLKSGDKVYIGTLHSDITEDKIKAALKKQWNIK